ncbi:MAG: hypothetical protein RR525_04490, partial [Cellulosilyticaceae bacterium]
EIKHLLKEALTDNINDREVYIKGIDASYYYEGYNVYSFYSPIIWKCVSHKERCQAVRIVIS